MIEKTLYKHYKGNFYQVIAIATNSETLEEYVVYESVKDHHVWVRPASMWEEEVIVEGIAVKRFSKV